MYETKICDICDMQKRFTQIWVDFEQNVIQAAIDQWHHVYMLVVDTLNTCCEIIVHLHYVVH